MNKELIKQGEEILEKLGYRKTRYEDTILYKDSINFINKDEEEIAIYIEEKEIEKYFEGIENYYSREITLEEFKAINLIIKGLGWIKGDE